MPTYHYTAPGPRTTFGRPWTRAVRAIIIANGILFLLRAVFGNLPGFWLLGLQVPDVFSGFRLWQPFTYLWFHADFWHLFVNLFTLWMFGSDVEQELGARSFTGLYLFSGVGAGLCVGLAGWLAGEQSLTIGASGAVFGVLAAFGALHANRRITLYLFFILPVSMTGRTLVLVFAAIEFLAGVGGAWGQVSHLAHLCGLGLGYLFLRLRWRGRTPPLSFYRRLKHWWLSRRVRRISPQEDPETYVDAILEKISRQGMGSLTPREREILAQASRRRQSRDGSDWN